MLSQSILVIAMVIFKVTSQRAGMITFGRGLQNDITAYASVGVEDPETAWRWIWVGGTSINGALLLGWSRANLITVFVRLPI